MSDTNTGPQGGAPELPNNWTGKKPNDDKAPNVEGNPYTPQTSQSNIRGKQGQ